MKIIIENINDRDYARIIRLIEKGNYIIEILRAGIKNREDRKNLKPIKI